MGKAERGVESLAQHISAAEVTRRATVRGHPLATPRTLPAGMVSDPSAFGVAAPQGRRVGPPPAPLSAGRVRGAKAKLRRGRSAAVSAAQPLLAAPQRVDTEAAPPLAGQEKKAKKKRPQKMRMTLKKSEGVRARGTAAGVSAPSRRGASRSQALPLPAASQRCDPSSPAMGTQAAAGVRMTSPVGTKRTVTPRPPAPWSQPCFPGGSQRQEGCKGR